MPRVATKSGASAARQATLVPPRNRHGGRGRCIGTSGERRPRAGSTIACNWRSSIDPGECCWCCQVGRGRSPDCRSGTVNRFCRRMTGLRGSAECINGQGRYSSSNRLTPNSAGSLDCETGVVNRPCDHMIRVPDSCDVYYNAYAPARVHVDLARDLYSTNFAT